MKIYFSAASPFVRKCLVCAIELGLDERIERLAAAAHPINRDRNIVASNPLGKVPTFVTDDGAVLYDSRVICEYLDAIAAGKLFPREGTARWSVLTEQALADGLLDAAILTRYEGAMRPAEYRWSDWTAGQLAKVRSALQVLEANAARYGGRVDIGTIAAGCALGYLDFRFPDIGWRTASPALAGWYEGFAQRPSMQRTLPAG